MKSKRDMINAARGRFVSVTFTKKDGSEHVMRIQPATLKKHVKGVDASESAQKASQTHAERYPHVMPVRERSFSASARYSGENGGS
jgi:hypothetical protein